MAAASPRRVMEGRRTLALAASKARFKRRDKLIRMKAARVLSNTRRASSWPEREGC